MTRNRARKNAVRAKAAADGVNYTEARTRLGADTIAHAAPWYDVDDPDSFEANVQVSLIYTETNAGRIHTSKITDARLIALAHAQGAPASELNAAARSPFPAPAGLVHADMTYDAANLHPECRDDDSPVQRGIMAQRVGAVGLLYSNGAVVGAWARHESGTYAVNAQEATYRLLPGTPITHDAAERVTVFDLLMEAEVASKAANVITGEDDDESPAFVALMTGQNWLPVNAAELVTASPGDGWNTVHEAVTDALEAWLAEAADKADAIFVGSLVGEWSSDFTLVAKGASGLWEASECGPVVEDAEAVCVNTTEPYEVVDALDYADEFTVVHVQGERPPHVKS